MSPAALPPLAVLGGILVVAALVVAVRHAVPRRLALRSIARRPGETVLVVLGSLLGTAIITGSFIVGDTLDASIRASARTQLGPIDETVTAFGTEALPALRESLDGLQEHPAIDGVTYGVRSSGTIGARLDAEDSAVRPSALLLEIDFEEAAGFGGDPEATGLEGTATPGTGEAVVSEDLAEELEVDAGDRITVFAYGGERSLRVTGVVPRVGLAGYSTDFNSQSFNVFLSPGTLAGLVDEAPKGLEASPPLSLAFVSNTGDVFEGADRTRQALGVIRERLQGIEGADVIDSKRDVLDQAEEQGSQFSELFLSIGAFAVIAGILLLVNIFVMLAEERKGELGMMRAVGMRRAQLVRAFYLEGSMYAAAASVLGAVAGIGVGAAIVLVAADIFAGAGDFSLELIFTPELASIAGGFLIGLLISLVTAFATSLRISRLNVIRAIRDLPEPPAGGRRLRSLVLGWLATLGGVAITAQAVVSSNAAAGFAGPGLLGMGLTALLGRFLPRRWVVTVIGLLVVAWGIFGPTAFPDVFGEAETPVFVLQGVLLTGAAVAVLAANQASVGRWVRAVSGGTRNLAARLGLAYPLAKRFRTTMTLSMYALVVFTLIFISVLSNIFGGQVEEFTEDEAGGYELLVRSSAANPLAPGEAEAADGVALAAPLRFAAFSVEFKTEDRDDFEFWALSGIDERFIEGGPPELESWSDAYRSEEEVWEAVLEDPTLIVLDGFFLQQGGPEDRPAEVGETVVIRDPVGGTMVERTAVGKTLGGFAFSGPFVSQESILEVLGERAAPNRLYVSLDPGASAEEVAAFLEEDHIESGVEARTFGEIVSESQSVNLQFFRLMQGYLALGLLVGISGLGVIMVRSVRERRREVGVLRSLGFQPGTVGRSFLLESAFVAMEGLLIGAALSIVTAYQLLANAEIFGSADITFEVPWIEVAVLLAVTLVASLLATGWPARQASRIEPAVALRITD